MEQIGYSLIDGSGTEVQFWGDDFGRMRGIPDRIVLPNGHIVDGPKDGGQFEDWKLVRRMGQNGEANSVLFDGTDVIVTRTVPAEKIVAERERRLANGFTYTFEDERGSHAIGTTEQDMKGWSEVTMASQAAMALGMTTAPITIVTNTGPVTITAQEWQQILLAAAQFRQPIWAASFALLAMSPIPTDYASDGYWDLNETDINAD